MTGPDGVLTPERFVTDLFPGLPVPRLPVAEDRDFHLAAYRDACHGRGLEMRPAGEKRYEIVAGGTVVGALAGMVSDLVSEAAVSTCRNKARTVARLAAAGVPTPEQEAYDEHEIGRGLDFARRHEFDVVVKPCFGGGGRGVSTAIPDAEAFRAAWKRAADANKMRKVVVETRCPGIDIRAIVVAGRFVCAATRMPAHVVGDGASTIEALIAGKNAARAAHPYHARYPIVADARLLRRVADAGFAPDSVLPEGQPLVLAEVSNIHAGGDACEITDFVPPQVRDIAVQAAVAVRGLEVAGVDLLVTALGADARAVVIEMDTHANFSIHHAPFRGDPRNPAIAVVEAMMRRAGRQAAS